jgi:hypothetical protein
MVGAIRVALLTTVIPLARRSGGEVVDMAFVDALRDAGHEVHAAGWLPPDAPDPREPWVELAGRRHIETAEAPASDKALWLARALARRVPYSLAKYAGSEYDRAAAAATVGAALTIVNHAQAPAKAQTAAPVVHIAHNVEHDLYADAAARAGSSGRRLLMREARLMERRERQLATEAVAVWCLTQADAARFAALGARRTVVFPVPGRPAHSSGIRPDREGVALIGNWTWEPNAVGLRWFATQVAPQLDASLKLAVAGAGAEQALGGSPERLSLLGRIPDADEFLAKAKVVVVPAMAGGGIQVKTLDAIAAGASIVTTPMGVRGIDDPPASVRVEDDPQRFAAAVNELAATAPSDEGIAWAQRRAERFAQLVAQEVDAATS